jgi:hypothetical protein
MFCFKKRRNVREKKFDVVLSGCRIHGKTIKIARDLEKRGVNVLLTEIGWPRDEMVFLKDGGFIHCQKGTIQGSSLEHRAWVGGEYLVGGDFLIGTTAIPEKKRKKTVDVLRLREGFFYDIDKEIDELREFSVSGREDFYDSKMQNHMDMIFNIGTRKKHLFTYENKRLEEKAREISKDIGYETITLPIKDALVAGVGFIEVGDSIVIDRRARGSIRLLKSLGYNTIPTPYGLKQTNSRGGSLRCITTELRLNFEELEFADNKKSYRDSFWNTNSQGLITPSKCFYRRFD